MLKDHGSAGVTGALKNMSHGLVNNVNRSHSTPDTNVCNHFIPQVVAHPIIRKKCVLHIMDGIKGCLPGGSGGHTPEWTWENNALLLRNRPRGDGSRAWKTIDAKRKEKGCRRGGLGQARPRSAGEARVRYPPAPAHSPGRQPRAWASSSSTHPEVASSRSTTGSSTWREIRRGRRIMENDAGIARRQVTIVNTYGLHMRPSTRFVKLAS